VRAIPRTKNTLIFFVFPCEKTFTVINTGEGRAENKERERVWVSLHHTVREKIQQLWNMGGGGGGTQ
jgi:hypothetical protein